MDERRQLVQQVRVGGIQMFSGLMLTMISLAFIGYTAKQLASDIYYVIYGAMIVFGVVWGVSGVVRRRRAQAALAKLG
jgi:hypothetical protein